MAQKPRFCYDQGMKSKLAVLQIGALACSLSPPAAAAEKVNGKEPVAVLRLEKGKGFIDDPFALSPDGKTLYYVATDGATFAELRAAAVTQGGSGSPGSPGSIKDTAQVGGLPLSVSRLVLLPGPGGADRVLVISRDPENERESAVVYAFGPKAPAALPGKVGPAGAIALGQVGAAPAVVAVSQPGRGQGGDLRISAHAVAAQGLRPLSARSYRVRAEDGGLTLAGAPAQPLYFVDGYLGLVARQAGAFDKKSDVRQPDRLVLFDTLGGKVRQAAPIADPTATAELGQLRGRYPGESIFVTFDAERAQLSLVGAPAGDIAAHGQRRALKMARPLAQYDGATLRYQLLGDKGILVSLTVDPVNEAAVARKKRDPDFIDFCYFPLAGAGGDGGCPLSLPGNERPSAWQVASSGRLAVLRKHKGFSRGGTDLEIYDLDLDRAGAREAAK